MIKNLGTNLICTIMRKLCNFPLSFNDCSLENGRRRKQTFEKSSKLLIGRLAESFDENRNEKIQNRILSQNIYYL